MRNSRYSDEQIERAVGEAEAGAPVAEIVRQLGISEATFCAWKKRIDVLGTPEVNRLRDENARLTKLVADLTYDHQRCEPCAVYHGRSATSQDNLMRR